jgi:hypothetical protein
LTLITGIFKDSGGVAIASGVLRVKLDAPLKDIDTDPDSYHLQVEHDFSITNGVLSPVTVKESQTSNTSYTFTVLQSFTDYTYYKAGTGDYYSTNDEFPSHLYTDGKYYSGVNHAAESIPLERIARPRLETVGEAFQAIVPNVAEISFAQLERTGFATDRGPQTAKQVGEYLKTDPLFLQSLVSIVVSQGEWNAAILYRRGNLVSVGGSTYQCLAQTSINQPPAANPTIWQLFAAKGNPGGTSGDNSAFGAGWSGDLNAPSKNAIYQEFTNNRATKAQVDAKAPLASPTLTGLPLSPTQIPGTGTGTNKTAIATCEYVDVANAALIQLPISAIAIASSPTPPARSVQANGQALSRTVYAALFAIIGTTFGVGDGSTTFNVPTLVAPGANMYYVIVTGV